MSSLLDQICFTDEANCLQFKGHMLKANICTSCMKDIAKHNRKNVNEDDLVKALEHTQKGEKTPSLILSEGNGCGRLYLGGFKVVNSEFLSQENVTAILNTVGDGLFKLFGRKFEESYQNTIASNNITYLSLAWEDSISYEISDDDLYTAIKFIHQSRHSGSVLVHCAQGKSRSTTAVVAYLMTIMNYNLKEALLFTQERRKMAEPNAHFMYLLHEFGKSDLLKRLRTEIKQLELT